MRTALGSRSPLLILGVTPELTSLSDELVAVDRSPEMIDGVWPGDTARRRAIAADWRSLPLPDRSMAAAVGDGTFNVLTYPDGCRALCTELRRVLERDAVAVVRAFCAPEEGEDPAAVISDARAGRIANFHAFKWRLAMALASETPNPNVAVEAIRSTFLRLVPDRSQLAREAGWSRQDIDTIDVYEGSEEIYCFPTQSRLLDLLSETFSVSRARRVGAYPLAERCPLVVLENG